MSDIKPKGDTYMNMDIKQVLRTSARNRRSILEAAADRIQYLENSEAELKEQVKALRRQLEAEEANQLKAVMQGPASWPCLRAQLDKEQAYARDLRVRVKELDQQVQRLKDTAACESRRADEFQKRAVQAEDALVSFSLGRRKEQSAQDLFEVDGMFKTGYRNWLCNYMHEIRSIALVSYGRGERYHVKGTICRQHLEKFKRYASSRPTISECGEE